MNGPVLAGLAFGVVLMSGTGLAQAAAPANDTFAAATPLAVGDEVSSTNLDATVEAGEPNPTSFSESTGCPTLATGPACGTSVWFNFQPALSGEYTIETCDGGTDLDTILGVYTGATLGALALVGANDEVAGCAGGRDEDGSRVTFAATGGTVYRVDVTGYGADQGSFYLRAYAGPAEARPQPDTQIVRRASLATVLNTLETGPGATSGPRHSASFALESVAGASFQCSLDGAEFTACATPVSYDGVAPGPSHVFRARAIAGGATDPTPALQRFTVDTTPPDAGLTSGPAGPLASQEAVWGFSGNERYGPGFSGCGLDSMPSFQCVNTAKFENLCQGPHVFRATVFDPAANADPTPATAQVNVTVGPGCAAPTVGTATSVFPSETGATVIFPFDDRGAGAILHLEYGPTTAYGMDIVMGAKPDESAVKRGIQFLEPNTVYHFRVTIETPFGQASTPDQTLTTKPLETTRPAIQNGTPTVTGEHAASIPVTIDPMGVNTNYRTVIAAGRPVTATEPSIFDPRVIPGSSSGPQAVVVQVVDLEPATTYHYRIAAEQAAGNSNETLGPEGTFTTPPFPNTVPISGPGRSRFFKLRRRQVKIGKLTHDSKVLIVKVRGLPAKTKVKLKLTVGGSKQSARKKAKANGRVKFKMQLSKRIRKALRDEKVRKFKLKVTARPPGEPASSVTFRKRIRG
jgi:hypothetical protein